MGTSGILLADNALLVLLLMLALWLVSVWRRDASIVDPWWSMGFLLVSVHTVLATGSTPGKGLLLALVSIWAIRLWLHLLARSIGKAEDPRYAAFRHRFGAERYWWVSLFQVFLLQGALILIISAPLQVAAAAGAPDPVSATDLLGVALFLAGFTCEAVADFQLQRFRDAPPAPGAVLDTGLWRYSRHPNYFGEALLWWGFWAFSLDTPWGLATVFSPALMSFLLLRVSGVTLLESQLSHRKPGYAAYVRRTSAFLPWPPSKA